MDKYRQMSFVEIPSAAHPISFDLRDRVVKLSRNNVVTGEEHLRFFIDMLNNFEVEHEYMVMNFFVHSLTKDAWDWFKRLPNDNISSWSDLERILVLYLC